VQRVDDTDGVAVADQLRMSASVAQRKAPVSSLKRSLPSVALQRKTRAMIPRFMFL
jgi:hypothetical protein